MRRAARAAASPFITPPHTPPTCAMECGASASDDERREAEECSAQSTVHRQKWLPGTGEHGVAVSCASTSIFDASVRVESAECARCGRECERGCRAQLAANASLRT